MQLVGVEDEPRADDGEEAGEFNHETLLSMRARVT
jgi:hypothetical protein